jgi:tetratricopeptide (TPR) repeat protein
MQEQFLHIADNQKLLDQTKEKISGLPKSDVGQTTRNIQEYASTVFRYCSKRGQPDPTDLTRLLNKKLTEIYEAACEYETDYGKIFKISSKVKQKSTLECLLADLEDVLGVVPVEKIEIVDEMKEMLDERPLYSRNSSLGLGITEGVGLGRMEYRRGVSLSADGLHSEALCAFRNSVDLFNREFASNPLHALIGQSKVALAEQAYRVRNMSQARNMASNALSCFSPSSLKPTGAMADTSAPSGMSGVDVNQSECTLRCLLTLAEVAHASERSSNNFFENGLASAIARAIEACAPAGNVKPPPSCAAAAAYLNEGAVHVPTHRITRAISCYRCACDMSELIYGSDSLEVAECCFLLAGVMAIEPEPRKDSPLLQESVDLFTRALTIRRSAQLSIAEDVVIDVHGKEKSRRRMMLVSECLAHRGEVHYLMGNCNACEDDLLEALDIQLDIYGDSAMEVAALQSALGDLYRDKVMDGGDGIGAASKALENYGNALSTYIALSNELRTTRSIGETMASMSDILFSQGRFDECIHACGQALKVIEDEKDEFEAKQRAEYIDYSIRRSSSSNSLFRFSKRASGGTVDNRRSSSKNTFGGIEKPISGLVATGQAQSESLESFCATASVRARAIVDFDPDRDSNLDCNLPPTENPMLDPIVAAVCKKIG